jgi:hypothetical protein
METMAVLLSQSGFSPKAMIHATSSKTPLCLVHLPGGQPVLPPQPEDLEVPINDVTAWCNPALLGPRGVLGPGLEVRREIMMNSGHNGITGDSDVRARVGLWFNGERFTGFKGHQA